jgi:hypothetical protein
MNVKKSNFALICAGVSCLFLSGALASPHYKPSASTVHGYVYFDLNNNGVHDSWDPGVRDVSVSNGKEVVQTNSQGYYELPAYDEMMVFISKPVGYTPPLSKNNVPQISYIHEPKGSPASIKQFHGIDPTGPLPASVDFPLLREQDSRRFKAIITGDIQSYTDKELEYFRNSTIKEITGMKDALGRNINASFILSMGDNVGDNLALYPRLLNIMSKTGMPVWLVAGNHDVNYDAPDAAHSYETFKREFGPNYYSFNYGEVHFVVLNDIYYPDSLHSYHGYIDSTQMTWLANDLKFVSKNNLIVLNMHIPIVSDVDRTTPKHNVTNREALYALLRGRKVVALAGHTHTIDHFLPGELKVGWGSQLQIPEVIVGASCGSWWSGDFDNDGVPMSYQRDGAPRGYQIWKFDGSYYADVFKATGKDPQEQMQLSFLTPSFQKWFSQQLTWAKSDTSVRSKNPPVTINDLPDQGIISQKDLDSVRLIANIWNGSQESQVSVRFDDGVPRYAVKVDTIGDPYALRLQSYVFRYGMKFNMYGTTNYGPAAPQPEDASNIMINSYHIWSYGLPSDLAIGKHYADVSTTDMNGNTYSNKIVFEVAE